MNFPCCVESPCQDPANPFLNLTAEGPDPFIYIGFPPPGNTDPPPLGWSWIDTCTGGQFVSTVSQEDADLSAARAAAECIPSCPPGPGGCWRPPGDPPGDPPPPPLFGNIVVGCESLCPDGLPFNFSLPANQVFELNQDYCNQVAQSIACQIGARQKVCLSSISSSACINQAYSQVIFATGGNTPYFYVMLSGSLPPGINLTQPADGLSLIVSGTPTTTGFFQFTIEVIDRFGLFMQKTYSISVLNITNSPSTASVGNVYSFQFTATGGVPPYTFAIASGSLPAGLDMDANGLITGRPTASGTFNIGVSVTDSAV